MTCSNGSVTPIAVDPSTTIDSGSNDSSVGATAVTACGQTIYQASSIDDKTHADDSVALDDAFSETDAQNVSILGGLVTFAQEQAPATCQDNPGLGEVTCGGEGKFKSLAINGSPVALGTYLPGTTFQIVNAQVLTPGCIGASLFTGKVVLLDSKITDNGTDDVEAAGEWIHLTGQAVCLGLPLGSTTTYDLADFALLSLAKQYDQMIEKTCGWGCARTEDGEAVDILVY